MIEKFSLVINLILNFFLEILSKIFMLILGVVVMALGFIAGLAFILMLLVR